MSDLSRLRCYTYLLKAITGLYGILLYYSSGRSYFVSRYVQDELLLTVLGVAEINKRAKLREGLIGHKNSFYVKGGSTFELYLPCITQVCICKIYKADRV